MLFQNDIILSLKLDDGSSPILFYKFLSRDLLQLLWLYYETDLKELFLQKFSMSTYLFISVFESSTYSLRCKGSRNLVPIIL